MEKTYYRKYSLFSALCLIIITISLLTSCQATPTEQAVQNRTPNIQQQIEETQSIDTPLDIPTLVQDKIEKKDFVVEINAPVVFVNQKYSVTKAQPYIISDELGAKFLEVFIGDRMLVSPELADYGSYVTREQIEKAIPILIKEAKATGELGDPEAQKNSLSFIEELKRQLKTAPLEKDLPGIPRQFAVPEANANQEEGDAENASSVEILSGAVNMGKDTFASIFMVRNTDHNYNNGVYFRNQSTQEVSRESEMMVRELSKGDSIPSLKTSQAEAITQANQLLDSLGIKDMGLVHVLEVATDPIMAKAAFGYFSHRDMELNLPSNYCLYFTPLISNIPATYTLITDWDLSQSMSAFYPQESIIIMVNDSGVTSFSWEGMTITGETINVNVKLMAFEEILNVFKQQIYNHYAFEWDVTKANINIDRITLGMMKVKEPQTENYIYIPVWDFFGYTNNTYDSTTQLLLDANNQSIVNPFAKSFLTINAMDGSVIDRINGY